MTTPIQTIDFISTSGQGTHSSSDSLPEVTRGVYNRSLLKRAYPYLMHQQFGQHYPLGLRKGQSMVFRRYEKLAQNTVPLTEGVTPEGTNLVKRDYVATIKQYGDYMIISDFVDMTHVDPIIQQGVELMGEAMGESMDSVYREYLVVGTAVGFTLATGLPSGTTPTRSDVVGSLCPEILDAALVILKREEAKIFKPTIPGSVGHNTFPVAKAYWCLIHTDVEEDLYLNFNVANDAGSTSASGLFVPVESYAAGGGVMENEVGKYRNIRFITSTNTKVWTGEGAASADVYAALIFGRDAYGIVPLQRGSGRTIIQRSGGNTDPLEQRNTVGWKSAGCAIILNDAWMYRVEATTGVATPA